MRYVYITLFTIAMLVLPADAQQGPGRGEGRGEGFGRGGPGRGQGQGRGRGPGGPMRGGRGFGGMAQYLADELNMSEDQRAEFDVMVENFRARMEEHAGTREQMRELGMAYREARDSGDEEGAEMIRAQMEAQRETFRGMMDEFSTEVETILDDGQVQQMRTMREQFRQRRGRGQGMREMARSLPDDLGLSDEQRAEYDVILDEHRSEMRAQWEGFRDYRVEWGERMAAAREAGDEELMAELHAEMQENRPQRPDPDDLFSAIDPILTDEQRAQLDEIRANQGERGPRGEGLRGPRGEGRRGEGQREAQARRRPVEPRELLRAVRRLDLDDEQREQLKDLARDGLRTENRGRDRDARGQSAMAFEDQIRKLLTDEQEAELDRMIKRDSRGGRGREERARGNRGEGQRRRNRGDWDEPKPEPQKTNEAPAEEEQSA